MTTFERIQALIELKEKGAISDLEFKQMLELIEAEGDTTIPKKTVQPEKQKKANETSSRVKEDIAALREKKILEQVIGANEKKKHCDYNEYRKTLINFNYENLKCE